MKITLLTDSSDSWIIPYVQRLHVVLKKNHQVQFITDSKKIKKGDLAFFLGCTKKVDPEILRLNKHNLVVHESKLPKGRGWSPLTWQILEGKNRISIMLFEAKESIDSGVIFLTDVLKLEGHELVDELRKKQGEKTIELVKKFISLYPKITGKKQKGTPTYYPHRTPKNSELDINQPIKNQFNLFRTVDNERYPAFFRYKGKKYILKIYKDNNEKNSI